jgi:sulfonate transport system substrate-binding protein
MTSFINRFHRCIGLALAVSVATFGLVVGTASTAFAGENNYGKVGDPIHLTVGYQPYYTESWSGVVMQPMKFYEKYLPKGSTVDFSVGLQGAVIVNAMLAGKQDIGYMGDMPAIVSTTKQQVADLRIVATVGLGLDQCNVFLARKDAPKFANQKDAIKWLDGKRVAVPKGSCTDRFAQAVFKQMGVQPASYLNQNIEVITSGFRAGKIDAAVIWEPTASRLVEEGLARRIASGTALNEHDGGFLVMRNDLMQQRPDVVKAWLNAELDAQLYMANQKNAENIVRMVKGQTTGFTEKVLWKSLYGTYPESEGGTPVRVQLPYIISPDAAALIKKATTFLYSVKSINTPTLRADAVSPQYAEAVLKERGLTSPIGEVKALPDSAYKGE